MPSDVTAIKAFAARAGSSKISITVSRRNQVLVHLNGDELAFDRDEDASTQLDTMTLRFDDFSIAKNFNSSQFTLSWSLGVSIQVTPAYINTASTRVLNVAAAVSGELKGEWTLGLIGGYDGNATNDLRDRDGQVVGTVETLTPQEIHEVSTSSLHCMEDSTRVAVLFKALRYVVGSCSESLALPLRIE